MSQQLDYQKQHEVTYLELDLKCPPKNYALTTWNWTWNAPKNYALTTGVKYGPCPIGPGLEKKRRIFDDSVKTPATARGFANGFFLGHLWDVLPWSRSSHVPVSHRQVARDGGAEGLSRGKGRAQAKV